MWTDKDLDEVIAFRIDDEIWFGQEAVNRVLARGSYVQYYTRALFKFMAEMDLNPKWKEWSDNAPTLFLRSDIKNDNK